MLYDSRQLRDRREVEKFLLRRWSGKLARWSCTKLEWDLAMELTRRTLEGGRYETALHFRTALKARLLGEGIDPFTVMLIIRIAILLFEWWVNRGSAIGRLRDGD